jgi:hypothetical protein
MKGVARMAPDCANVGLLKRNKYSSYRLDL